MKFAWILAPIALALFLVRGWLVPTLIATVVGLPDGVPIGVVATGKPVPQIGLRTPLPSWMPLPEHGSALGASLFPSRPHYGAGATLVMKVNETQDAFVTSYGRVLAKRGFALRQIMAVPNMIVDAQSAQLEADERNGGRAIFITLRGPFVQLMFWDAPAPHM